MSEKRFCLYAAPSFWEGVSRLIDVAGTLNEYNYSESEQEADFRALLSDWEAVGRDLQAAARQFSEAHHGQPAQEPVE